jgi:hypothetical protein
MPVALTQHPNNLGVKSYSVLLTLDKKPCMMKLFSTLCIIDVSLRAIVPF